jgi:hypothetical protein
VPETPLYEALCSQKCTVFSMGHIVYTEDVGGSSPSSPTIQLVDTTIFLLIFQPFCEAFCGFNGPQTSSEAASRRR